MEIARLDVLQCGANEATADACIVMNAIKALSTAPSTVVHQAEWQYASLKWRDELKSAPQSITWDVFRDRMEQELKDFPPDEEPSSAKSKTTTPSGVALYTLTQASEHLGIPVRRRGGRGGGDRGRGRGERGARGTRGSWRWPWQLHTCISCSLH